MLLLLAPLTLLAQDTRTVTEPTLPLTTSPASVTCSSTVTTNCVCAVLLAQQSAGSLNQTIFDTNSLSGAFAKCSAGQAVELAASGGNNAFLTQPISMNHLGTTLLIDAGVTLFASLNPLDYSPTCGTISTSSSNSCTPLIGVTVSGVSIMGYGTIDGQGGQNLVNSDGSNYTCPSPLSTPCTWWQIGNEAGFLGENQYNPTLLDLHSGASNFTLYKITMQNSPMFHVTNSGMSGFTAWDVKVIAPYNSPNTDGIDPGPNTSAGASNITVTNSFISTGDDMIAIKGNHPISNITISHNHFYTGHGVSIGSETNGGVNKVLVTDMTMSGNLSDRNENGLRIKSAQSEGGTVSNIDYEGVCILNEYNPLVFDPFYTNSSGTEYPYFKSVTLHNIHVTTASSAGGLLLDGYNSTYPLGLTLNNVVFDTAPKSVSYDYGNFTLGPDPVSFSAKLVSGSNNSTVTDVPGFPDGNPPYDCTGKWVYLAGEIFTTTPSVSGGEPVIVSVIVQPVVSGSPAPDGTVNILENGTVVATAAVASAGNVTTVTIPSPSAGQHTYTAEYTGDTYSLYSSTNYPLTFTGTGGVNSVTVTVTGPTSATNTTVMASPASPVYGNSVELTATVAPASGPGTPTGSVIFTVDGTPGVPVTLVNGSAGAALPILAAGSHSVSVAYSGDTTFIASSGAASVMVGQAAPLVAVNCPVVLYDGNAHSCTGTATGIGGAAVSGAFTFAPGSETTVGSYAELGTFTSADSNYANGSGSGNLVINASMAGTVSASISTTSLAFPAPIMMGQTSTAQYVLITSTGTAPLLVSGVAIGGTNPGDFTVSNQAGTCTTGASLGNHAECNLRIIFTPAAVGTRSAILYINDNLTGSPQQVAVSGTAISGAQLSLSAGTLTFPATKVGSTAATQYLTLKSTGFQPVIVSQVVLSSGDFDLSDQAGTCTTAVTTSLAPGASCNLRVKFHPAATGSRSATVTIGDNTATSPHTVTLNGTGE